MQRAKSEPRAQSQEPRAVSMRPARPATCGSHLLSDRPNVRCPNAGATCVTPRVDRDRRAVGVLSKAVRHLGRNEPQHRTPRPERARLPSLRSIAFRKRNPSLRPVNRSPLRAGGNRRVHHLSLRCRATHMGWTHRLRKNYSPVPWMHGRMPDGRECDKRESGVGCAIRVHRGGFLWRGVQKEVSGRTSYQLPATSYQLPAEDSSKL